MFSFVCEDGIAGPPPQGRAQLWEFCLWETRGICSQLGLSVQSVTIGERYTRFDLVCSFTHLPVSAVNFTERKKLNKLEKKYNNTFWGYRDGWVGKGLTLPVQA